MYKPLSFSFKQDKQNSVYGILNSVPNPLVVEMIAHAGYDFVVLDLEHLPHNEPLLKQCIQICTSHDCVALVRIANADLKQIGRVLDMGAHGVIVPQAEDIELLKSISSAMFFPPKGRRGITGGSVTGFGKLTLSDYINTVNENMLLIPMIESLAGVQAIQDILDVPGVAMIMEGALDLALNMGLGPEPTHPDVQQALSLIAAQCKQKGTPFCANPRNNEQLELWRSHGVTHYLCGEDRGYLYRALTGRLNEIRNA
ncbi:MAG TPA: 4-hydroxy-2-oxovalerate aldolase [Methylophaga aminisulfidivorans]|uniref:HpcH/HpaI aldolase family protein n=1 Tax=Methylophaga TaxID=40222 RepID=UPI001775EFC4|nr:MULTISPECIES: aldolase/citrate lyase family protein [Methylophaga]HIC47178.1 4-hydroxy-2-oxovalerate aldolase [Methylophaga sp.]HIM40167.1 4-hydroxy-2-oxovalerate aldolase [Methylophaga aminisulfidivorans]